MVDPIEAFRYVGVQYVLRFGLYRVHYLFDRVVAAPARSESVAVRFRLGLSFWFYGEFYQGLHSSIPKRWDSKRPPFFGPGFGYEYPSGRLGLGSDF